MIHSFSRWKARAFVGIIIFSFSQGAQSCADCCLVFESSCFINFVRLFMKGRIIHNSYSVVVRCPSFPSCSCDIDSLEETRPVLQNAPYFGFVWLFYHDQIQVKHFWQEFYIWNIVSVLILILFHWSLSVLCYAVPHCLDYSSFTGFEIGKFEPFNFVLFQDYPEYSGSFEFPYEF